ncbi:CtsR family transcriptional regulator [Alkaliphilus peptidifermentans]|uniref:Transcriptional regulator CtsR n=1 Tax=Alkaliphilus peptidifermentans DSM 18978 TaxID=1120976 RepID=A0A1G5KZE9_9FIRM|nr:CtsR family transcriptional regulator [Alkaliphilus peptidifermentans]SCZ05714.1 transcriptional regulator CtsR [Alkaliphilus peptidifermentans DSM 18978]
MARVSDLIEIFLKELFKETNSGSVEIQRNELAKYFDCSPSQINYVLMTRFTLKQGYTTESYRGGGGYVKITRLMVNQSQHLFHIITRELGDNVSKSQAARVIYTLKERNIITNKEAKIIEAAIDDNAIISPINIKDQIRAGILKNMLAVLLL